MTDAQKIERVYHAVVRAASGNPRKTEYGIARAAFETMEEIRAEEDAEKANAAQQSKAEVA